MSIFNSMNISASALTAQRLRMDIIASNIANANTTRATFENGKWMPYQRKMVSFSPQAPSFKNYLNAALGRSSVPGEGVKATQIVQDKSPFKQVYNPGHPDADENGFVLMPNVDVLKEMVDLISATRSYEASVTAFNASKSMALKALEIGR
ncbi:flagellar basal body rod protein FlgC [Microaerobacter geothermalis]|uniref:flagellar basal body rod protein FlgC n=1 Tax=Microaerobacter geothermalis TaxID=674972 RepID=UPI001F3291D8|nr:flagellar basal body rod protein FlgC [Microaerobacter geothermalis]MCF6093842.1 flagellar basal body rod protein FlgC [Microaerobacter geothermalis]